MRKRLFGMISTSPSLAYTAHGLATFFRHTPLGPQDKFVLLDNDGSFECVHNQHPLELIVNPSPLGYAQNANQFVDLALNLEADLFMMNNDLIFSPGWLEACEQDPTSITSPLSNREATYNLDWIQTPMQMNLEQYLEKPELFERLFAEHRKAATGLMKVTILPFFCVRIPLEVLRAVGHFDERYGKGGAEDYDYCLRAYLADFGVKYALSSFIIHFGGKSSWSGVESRQEQDQRELKFLSEFGFKWGQDLLKMCLFEDRSYFTPESPLTVLANQGKHREIVTSLLGPEAVQIHL